VAFHRMGRAPGAGEIAIALVLLVCASLVLYSLWILVVASAFYVVKVDNLSYLFVSIYDAARWPVSVFRGVLRLVFTFVVPLALMTTFPALALLGRLSPLSAAQAFLGRARPHGMGALDREVHVRELLERRECSASPSSAPRPPRRPSSETCPGSRSAASARCSWWTAGRGPSGR